MTGVFVKIHYRACIFCKYVTELKMFKQHPDCLNNQLSFISYMKKLVMVDMCYMLTSVKRDDSSELFLKWKRNLVRWYKHDLLQSGMTDSCS